MRKSSRTIDRCISCGFRREQCICSRIETSETKTKLALIIHQHDEVKPSNTGKLLIAAVPSCIVYRYGFKEHTLDYKEISTIHPAVLFPKPGARTISKELWQEWENPTLLVVDGTWSQAAKQANKLSATTEKFVTLPPGDYLKYKLRNSGSDDKLCTAQAVIEALKILGEDTEKIQAALDLFIENNLKIRGLR